MGFEPTPDVVAKRDATLAASMDQVAPELVGASTSFTGPDAQLSMEQKARRPGLTDMLLDMATEDAAPIPALGWVAAIAAVRTVGECLDALEPGPERR